MSAVATPPSAMVTPMSTPKSLAQPRIPRSWLSDARLKTLACAGLTALELGLGTFLVVQGHSTEGMVLLSHGGYGLRRRNTSETSAGET